MPLVLPAPGPLRKPPAKRNFVRFAAARDEQAVRRLLQRTHHRPKGEPWAKSILRIRAVHRRRIARWLAEGKIDDRIAKRLLGCTPPNSRLPKRNRRYCEHPSCPFCHCRRLLNVYRALWHGLCEPELERRRMSSRTRRGLRTRLALGVVAIDVAPDEAVEVRVRALLNDRVIRKMQRAGGIQDGIATIGIHHGKHGYAIRISVLGLSDRPVQHDQPQGPRSGGWCDPSRQWNIEWRAAVSGHDAPKFGPKALLSLLAKALPAAVDDSGLHIKRLQPLGRCRPLMASRPGVFPRPIRYKSERLGGSRFRTDQACPACGGFRFDVDLLPHLASHRIPIVANERCLKCGHTRPLDERDLALNPFLRYRNGKERKQSERLEQFTARRLLKRLGGGCGLSRSGINELIARFFAQSKAMNNWVDGGVVSLPWVSRQLAAPVILATHLLPDQGSVEGFMSPAERNGKTWDRVIGALERLSVDDRRLCLVLRPPGRERGAVVVHRLDDAAAFGRAERVGRSGAIVQHLDNFLDFVLDSWPDRPESRGELLERVYG
ncbi:MAG: hypothetical protein V2A79_02900 [Planctomycetota bacterium]